MANIFQNTRFYENGVLFRQEELSNYYVDFIDAESENLVIVFDGAEPKAEQEPWQRYPWGGMFIYSQGHSVLGVKHKQADWYRGKDLHRFFMSDELQDLFSRFKAVYLYGASMGAFAALVFAKAVPGAKVLACCPQSSLDARLAPWDKRFPHGTAQNWNGHFRDAAESLDNVDDAYVVYDPFFPMDLAHIKRLPQDKLTHLKAPFFQHDVLSRMKEMDLLKDLLRHFIKGDLKTWFPRALRERKGHNLYQSTAYFHLALRLYERGQRDPAIAMLTQSLKLCPHNRAALGLFHAMDGGQAFQWGDIDKVTIAAA